MSNYLDEYNKRTTYGNAMGFNPSPLAQTAHMHADRDRALNQQQNGPALAAHTGAVENMSVATALARALTMLIGGGVVLTICVLLIEKSEGILAILAIMGAFGGFIAAAFGAVMTMIVGLTSIGTLLRQKTLWAIAALSVLSGFIFSAGMATAVFTALMLGWGAFYAGRTLLQRLTPASAKD